MPVFTNYNGVIREAKDIYYRKDNVIRKVKSGRVGPGLAIAGQPFDGVAQTRSYFQHGFDIEHSTSGLGMMVFLLRQVRPTHQNLQRPNVHDNRLMPDSAYLSYFLGSNAEGDYSFNLNKYPLNIDVYGYASNSRCQWQLNMYLLDYTVKNAGQYGLFDAEWWAPIPSKANLYDEWAYQGNYANNIPVRSIHVFNPYYNLNSINNRRFGNAVLDVDISCTPITGEISSYIPPYIQTRNGVNNVPYTSTKSYSLLPNDNEHNKKGPDNGIALDWKMNMGLINNETAYNKTILRYTFDFRNKIKKNGQPINLHASIMTLYEKDWDKVDPYTYISLGARGYARCVGGMDLDEINGLIFKF
jgi:hypothetical protein